MKCSGCGAEIPELAKFCEYCGSQISYEMRREQEQINKAGCPKCHSSNIQFRRENQGEVRGKQSKRVIHRTVGFCKDCGYTWYPDTAAGVTNDGNQKSNMKWWVLGWIFFFPAPAMVLIWRKKNTWDIKVKIGVTVAFWILFFAIGAFGDKSDGNGSNTQATVNEVAEEEAKDKTEIADDNKEIELKAGEIGEYGRELVLNEGTDSEDRTIGYFVPVGTYEVKNIGDKPTQVNVYKDEKNTTDEGWEEWADGKVELIDVNETKEMKVGEGYFFNIDAPAHISIKKINE